MSAVRAQQRGKVAKQPSASNRQVAAQQRRAGFHEKSQLTRGLRWRWPAWFALAPLPLQGALPPWLKVAFLLCLSACLLCLLCLNAYLLACFSCVTDQPSCFLLCSCWPTCLLCLLACLLSFCLMAEVVCAHQPRRQNYYSFRTSKLWMQLNSTTEGTMSSSSLSRTKEMRMKKKARWLSATYKNAYSTEAVDRGFRIQNY